MKRFNKKGMMDDWFDFLFTVISCFFILLFIGIYIRGAVDAQKREALNQLEKTVLVDDYLVEQRVVLGNDGEIDITIMDKKIEELQRFGKMEKDSSSGSYSSVKEGSI